MPNKEAHYKTEKISWLNMMFSILAIKMPRFDKNYLHLVDHKMQDTKT